MSKGPGRTMRNLDATLRGAPGTPFTVEGLAKIAYPGVAIENWHLVATRRALNRLRLPGAIKQKIGNANSTGWSYRILFAG